MSGSPLAGLLIAALQSKDSAPYPAPRSWTSTPLARVERSPPQLAPTSGQPTQGKALALSLRGFGQAVPRDTPGSAFSLRHRGA